MPKVFISYRQIDDTQRKRVRALAEQIRARGIEVTFDQFYKDVHAGGPPEGWPKWSRDQAISAPRVLIIGNAPWFRCFEGIEQPGVGLGAACEARNLFQRLYDIAGKNEIMRVVYFDDSDVASISHDLKGYDRFHAERNFEDIIRWLLDISAVHSAPPRSDAKPNNIPFHTLGDLFKGRVDDIQKLHDALHSGARAAGISAAPAIAATHGLGGIGKTRLAVEDAWRHAVDYDALLFISGETKEKLETTFAALTGELILDLSERHQPDPAAQKTAVIKWLRAHPRYLLVIDNVDDAEALKAAREFMKDLVGGHIILTGRISNWGNNVKPVPLSVLSTGAAVDYLFAAAFNRLPCADDKVMTRVIAEKLGGLALALEQAAGYINTQHITCARYLEDWEKHHDKVLQWFDDSQTDYPRSVAATWQTSFDKLKPGAARLLELLAWFAPDPIPDALLEDEGTAEMNGEGQPAVDANALADLFRYNFATRESAEPMFTIHRLVQDVTRRRLEKEGRAAALRQQAIEWMHWVFDGGVEEVNNWPQFDPLAIHALTLAEWADFAHDQELAGYLYSALALWNASHGRYSIAIGQDRLAVAHLQNALGPEHPDTLASRNNLASDLQTHGLYGEAETEHRAVLEIQERVLGTEHPATLASRDNLASALRHQGKHGETEAEHRARIEIEQRVLGPEHPDTLASRRNLASALAAQGKNVEAEVEHRARIEIEQRVLGPEHPDTLASRNNLANALRAQGKQAEAEAEHRTTLEIMQRVLGPEHPTTLAVRNNLANALQVQGKHSEAEAEHRARIEVEQRVLGPEHPIVFRSCHNLSLCLEDQGKKPEALTLARRAFEGLRKTLGESHPETLNAQKHLRNLEQTP